MKRTLTRILAASAVLLSTAGAAGAPVHAGAALKTYSDAARYVTFKYPANWTVGTALTDLTGHAAALGIKSSVSVTSPDSRALFGVAIKPSLSTVKQERADAISLLKENLSIVGSITFTNLAPQYGPRLVAKAEVRFDATHEGIELIEIADEGRGKTVYAFELLLRKPMAPDSEAHQLADVFNSLIVG